MIDTLKLFLSKAQVAPAVFKLRPDYRALLLAVGGIESGESDDISEELLLQAEAKAAAILAGQAADELPHVAAWREAYRAFGAKPQRTRNSLESLLRRVTGGLPRVNRITDIYNAISVMHLVPIGGEDLDNYQGSPQLVVANGEESFDTFANGEAVIEHPLPGEVVWRDEAGVTCRRWNWRQGRRTALTEKTRNLVFFFDALAPCSDDALFTAANHLTSYLEQMGPNVVTSHYLIRQ